MATIMLQLMQMTDFEFVVFTLFISKKGTNA